MTAALRVVGAVEPGGLDADERLAGAGHRIRVVRDAQVAVLIVTARMLARDDNYKTMTSVRTSR